MLPGRSPAEIKRIIGPKSRGALHKYLKIIQNAGFKIRLLQAVR